MSLNTLETAYSNGQVIDASHVNELTLSLLIDFVGRDANGVPTSGQNLGTVALPWGTVNATNFNLNGSPVDVSQITSPANRIVSGKVRSTSGQPQFLLPNGAAASFILEGLTTNLVLDVNGAVATVNTDITKSGLTVGPSTTATCLVNDATAADQEETKLWGEYQSEQETLPVDTMGAEFQTFIGQWVVVQIAGVATEYALVFVKSATELTNCYRGFFTNSSSAPVNRTAFTDGDVITVLSSGHVFVEDNGTTVDVSYTNPIVSFTAPSAPATGDYWKDLGNNVWKRYDGASFQIIKRTYVGIVGIDSANCVCARSFDFHANYKNTNTIEIEINSTSIVQVKSQDSKINVYGNEFVFGFNHENWNITTDLAAAADMYNATEQASTDYYFYVAETGETVMSDISPYWRPDLLGYYHPHNPWKCAGVGFNDSGSDIILADETRFNSEVKQKTVFISDEKTSGTQGGGATANTVQIRDLNTSRGNTEIASVATNQITILPGEYNWLATPPAHGANRHQGFLYDISNAAYIADGSNAFTVSANTSMTVSFIRHRLILSKTRIFEIRHWTEITIATNGLGVSVDVHASNPQSKEVYTQVQLKKVG